VEQTCVTKFSSLKSSFRPTKRRRSGASIESFIFGEVGAAGASASGVVIASVEAIAFSIVL
jgi:hypothetical protein